MKIHYPIFDHLSKFMVNLLHEENSETGKKYFAECHVPWLNNVIFVVTNIALEILMYI